jgi:hypothetical protein
MVADLVVDAGRIASLLQTATASETRDLLRAIVQEVMVNPDTNEAAMTFFAIPKMPAEAGGPGRSAADANGIATNAERTPGEPRMSSHMYMAGVGFEPTTSGL